MSRVKEFDRILHACAKSKVAARTVAANESRRSAFKAKFSEVFGDDELAKLEVRFL